jgi:hypothetical protein
MTIYEVEETDFDFDDDGYMVAESRNPVAKKPVFRATRKNSTVVLVEKKRPMTADSVWRRLTDFGRSGPSTSLRP